MKITRYRGTHGGCAFSRMSAGETIR
jgi:hypothetical protein